MMMLSIPMMLPMLSRLRATVSVACRWRTLPHRAAVIHLTLGLWQHWAMPPMTSPALVMESASRRSKPRSARPLHVVPRSVKPALFTASGHRWQRMVPPSQSTSQKRTQRATPTKILGSAMMASTATHATKSMLAMTSARAASGILAIVRPLRTAVSIRQSTRVICAIMRPWSGMDLIAIAWSSGMGLAVAWSRVFHVAIPGTGCSVLLTAIPVHFGSTLIFLTRFRAMVAITTRLRRSLGVTALRMVSSFRRRHMPWLITPGFRARKAFTAFSALDFRRWRALTSRPFWRAFAAWF